MKTFDKTSVLVYLICCAVFIAWLGSRGLNDPDEGRFAEIGREMAVGGDWVVPHLNGIPHFQKPPMLYWLTALSIRGLGVNEWAVRLPSAVAAAGTVGFAMMMAGLLFGKSTRWKTGLILATCIEFFVLARVITTDMVLTFWITAAVAAFVFHAKRQSWLSLAGFYVAMGLGFLTKGPMALLVPCCAAFAWIIGRRCRSGESTRMFWWIGIPVTLAIGLSWFVVLTHRFPELLDYFARYELVQRIASGIHKRNKPFWYPVAMLSAGVLPWTVFLPGLLARSWRRRRAGDATAYLFIGWIAVPLIVLSLAQSKLATYVLPLIPPLAILLARSWEQVAGSLSWRWTVTALSAAFIIVLAAWPLTIVRLESHFLTDIRLSPWFAVGMGLSAGLFMIAPLLAWRPGGIAFVLPCLAVAIGSCLLTITANADRLILSDKATLRNLALSIAPQVQDPSIPVFVFNVRANSFEFYLQRLVSRTVHESDIVLPLDTDQQQRIISEPSSYLERIETGPAYVLVGFSRYQEKATLSDWHIVGQVRRRVLLTSPTGDGGRP
jgi:4-amino-4-deoxy-L-arabinose transferase-like glycosyltransferase